MAAALPTAMATLPLDSSLHVRRACSLSAGPSCGTSLPAFRRIKIGTLAGQQEQRRAASLVLVRAQKRDSEAVLSSEDEAAAGSSASQLQEGEQAVQTEDSDEISRKLSKAVRSTASTFAPRSSTRQKNPAVPGSLLFSVFEWQAYISMALGGVLSYNLVFPSNEPDIWRLMGMWSIWMFTIPSLRARDCSSKEKDALNYLFIVVPLINVTLPLVWRSFAAVWTADALAFFAMYAWKMEWFQREESN